MVGTIDDAVKKADGHEGRRLMPTLLEIVSPDRLLLSQPVDMAVIPAAEGEMGVTAGPLRR